MGVVADGRDGERADPDHQYSQCHPRMYPSILGQNGISVVWGATNVNSLPAVCTRGLVCLQRGSGNHGNGAAGHVIPSHEILV